MNCPKCGAQMPEGSKWCNQCGTKLEATKSIQEPGKLVYEHYEKKGLGVTVLTCIILIAIVIVLIDAASNVYTGTFASSENYALKTIFISLAVMCTLSLVMIIIQARVIRAQYLQVETDRIRGVGMKSKFSKQSFSLEPSQVTRVIRTKNELIIETDLRYGVDNQKIKLNISNAEEAANAVRKVCNL